MPAGSKKSISLAASVEVMEQIKSKLMVSKQDLLSWSDVPRSSFYFKLGDGIRGSKPSEMIITRDGELVDKTVVLQDVEVISSTGVLMSWQQEYLGRIEG